MRASICARGLSEPARVNSDSEGASARAIAEHRSHSTVLMVAPRQRAKVKREASQDR